MTAKYYLYAFGSNGESQLGLGHASDKITTPTQIIHPSRLKENLCLVRGGGNHTLALTRSGQVWGAGSNENRQLGQRPCQSREHGDTYRVTEFTELHGGISFCAAAWESSAYILNSHNASGSGRYSHIYTEGRARHGELGRGEESSSFPKIVPDVPTLMAGQLETLATALPGTVVSFAAGMYHYVAVLDNGDVYGWGRARNGQLGKTDEKCHTTPIHIKDVPFKAQRVTCGQYFTYIVGDSKSGDHLLLGDDKHGIKSKKPHAVMGWKDIGATWNAVFVLYNDGSLSAWGKSDLWQLVPVGLPKLAQIAVGSDHILAVTADNRVLSWGWAVHGNCGDTRNLKIPLEKGYVSGQYNHVECGDGVVQMVAAGYSTSFILTSETDYDEGINSQH